jgi:carbonic anhydrase
VNGIKHLVACKPQHPPLVACKPQQSPLVACKPQQSPIDFGRAAPFECVFPSDYLAINWGASLEGDIEMTDEGVKYIFNNITPGNGLYLSGDFFPLDQMHFHAPSEHKINGAGAAEELQIVHMQPAPKPENDQYVVLGLWVNAGDGREEVDRFFKDLTGRLKAAKESRNPARIPVILNPNALLPPCPEEFWRYEGSLTTKAGGDNPECVRWVFYRRPLLVSREILTGFIEVGHHAKGVQPLNRRFVLSSIQPPTTGD